MTKKNNSKTTKQAQPSRKKVVADKLSRRPLTGDKPFNEKAATQNTDKPKGLPPTMQQ